MSVRFQALIVIFATSLYGCSSVTVLPELSSPVYTGEGILGYPVSEKDLPDHQFLELNQEMRDFVAEHVSVHKSTRKKVDVLIDLLSQRMEYDPLVTSTASETFDQQSGNCLSFAAMFVAMGREAGLDLAFNDVEIRPVWSPLEKNRYISFRHINILVRMGGELGSIDLGIVDYNENQPLSKISDLQAEAQYYSNLSIDKLLEGDNESAFLYSRKALLLHPETSHLWSNLGSIYRSAGLTTEAEQAFLTSLQLDSTHSLGASNLAQLYTEMGDLHRAKPYSTIAQKHRNRNPYYRYDRAAELVADDPEKALSHIRAAIRHNPDDYRFYFLAAKIYFALGNKNQAEKQLKYAERAFNKTQVIEANS